MFYPREEALIVRRALPLPAQINMGLLGVGRRQAGELTCVISRRDGGSSSLFDWIRGIPLCFCSCCDSVLYNLNLPSHKKAPIYPLHTRRLFQLGSGPALCSSGGQFHGLRLVHCPLHLLICHYQVNSRQYIHHISSAFKNLPARFYQQLSSVIFIRVCIQCMCVVCAVCSSEFCVTIYYAC